MQTIDEKLARIDELRTQRAEIDRELAEILGISEPAEPVREIARRTPAKPAAAGKVSRWKTKPCCGSTGARHMKACKLYSRTPAAQKPAAGEERPQIERALSTEEYANVRKAMQDREFQSLKYAQANKLSLKEVNKAIRSSSYENYIDSE